MGEYFRETIRNAERDVPSEILYEVEDGKVLKIVEADRDRSLYWNDIRCYKCGDESDDYRRQRGSLKEHDFQFDDEFVREERKCDVFWQRISRVEFYVLYDEAQKVGKRRYEIGVGTYIIEG